MPVDQDGAAANLPHWQPSVFFRDAQKNRLGLIGQPGIEMRRCGVEDAALLWQGKKHRGRTGTAEAKASGSIER
jgi:hypothetical protein